MRACELRADEMHVVVHAAQDGVGDRLGGVAAGALVAVQLLDPLQVDHRHHADQQIDEARHVDVLVLHGAVQALVEQQVGAGRQLFPGGEGAGFLFVRLGFFGAVQVLAALAAAGLGVGAEQVLEFAEEVGLGPEVAQLATAADFAGGELFAHGLAVVGVEAVALDDGRGDAFTAEDFLEGALHGASAGTGRAGDGDDRMAFGHGVSPFFVATERTRCRGTASARGTAADRPARRR